MYHKFGKAALAKILSMVKTPQVASEILQEVFIKLWQSEIVFANERAAYGWIYQCCHHAEIDFLRSAVHRRETGVDCLATVVNGLAAYAATQDHDKLADRQQIQRHLLTLSPKEQEIFSYVALDQMTQIEVSTLMQISRKSVQRTLLRIETKFAKLGGGP